jgi:hypothetical protein
VGIGAPLEHVGREEAVPLVEVHGIRLGVYDDSDAAVVAGHLEGKSEHGPEELAARTLTAIDRLRLGALISIAEKVAQGLGGLRLLDLLQERGARLSGDGELRVDDHIRGKLLKRLQVVPKDLLDEMPFFTPVARTWRSRSSLVDSEMTAEIWEPFTTVPLENSAFL